MEILIAQHAGFCEGVERAYRIALQQTQAGKPVFMLGNLVHNSQVVEKFIKAGAKIVNSLDEIPKGSNGILLISAHGVPPVIYERAKGLELEIVDTTCPWVKKAQKIAKELADAGCLVIIVGDKGHKEVQGLVGWSNGKAIVVENLDDINPLSFSPNQKVGVLAQTTQSREHFKAMAAELKKKAPSLKEFDTICGATAKRQETAAELAKKVDLMLVIGDKMSANTKRLTELCQQTGTKTHQIQTVGEMMVGWLDGKQRVGITAGASTPEWVIKEVVAKLA
ncbi:MAG: 4-hydroxy-3-methylbut-2-enyl diphosphate reductase [Candidatus Margulisbacteria bacterium]|nr:4-hydroxy-3-methylbut-2-enyl diphosphate reductase [Candidatus Margulisiibacteriota bacterium]